jgi:hypothetical protein
MRSDEKPLYVGCGIKESRLPRVMKISSVNEQLGNAESARIAPRQEAVDDDVGDEQNNRSLMTQRFTDLTRFIRNLSA